MILPRGLPRLYNSCAQHPAPSVFVGALILIYLITLWNNEISWRGSQAELESKKQEAQTIHHDEPTIQHDEPTNQQSESTSMSEPYINSVELLTTPDHFRDHFDAVMRFPAISFEEAKAACNWPDESKVNFQFAKGEGGYGLDTKWTIEPKPQQELDEQREIWHNFMKHDLLAWKDYADKFSGRGIVVVGGRKPKRVNVFLRQLKRLNSQLPVELHYWANEVDEEKKRMFMDIYPSMHFNDLSAPHNPLQTIYGANGSHYNLKTAAMINSRFAEILMIDSDNIPIFSPDSLFESDEYKKFGTIFWPDIARTRPNNPVWSITNTKCRMDEYEQESGQLLVDKRKFFYHLQLSAFMNHPVLKDGFYSESYYFNFLLGDKDTFRFAWHALKTKFGKPAKFLTSVGTISGPEKFYCGHSFLQYHPDGRPLFMHGGLLKTMQKPVMKWQREHHGGIYQAYKKSEYEEQHDKLVQVSIGWDGLKYFPDKDNYNLSATWCTFMPELEARPLEELVPGFEHAFDTIGGYWPLDSEVDSN